jgi:hypothetical protein
MMNLRHRIAASSLLLAATSLASVVFTSQALAQCAECDEYQNRDPFTQGLTTNPTPGGTATPQVAPHAAYNAHAEMRGRHERNTRNSHHQHR